MPLVRRLLAPIRLLRPARGDRRRGRAPGYRTTALDDLVELAAIEPHPPALRAIVDLDPRPLAHHQGISVDRAGHRSVGHAFAPLLFALQNGIGAHLDKG